MLSNHGPQQNNRTLKIISAHHAGSNQDFVKMRLIQEKKTPVKTRQIGDFFLDSEGAAGSINRAIASGDGVQEFKGSRANAHP